jgi:hypothetical protein
MFLVSCRLNDYRPQNVNHRANESQKHRLELFSEQKIKMDLIWGGGGQRFQKWAPTECLLIHFLLISTLK